MEMLMFALLAPNPDKNTLLLLELATTAAGSSSSYQANQNAAA